MQIQTPLTADEQPDDPETVNIGQLDIEDDPVLSTLKTIFKFPSFRDGQREIIDRVLTGKDGIVLLPTGGGKLCFMLPALLTEGVCVVVLPTLSLMQDMLVTLSAYSSCFCLSSSTVSAEKDQILIGLKNNTIKFLLTTPEQLQDKVLQSVLAQCKISRFIVDEVHCIDE